MNGLKFTLLISFLSFLPSNAQVSNIFPDDDNVGIGTTTPSSKLQVEGKIATGKSGVLHLDWTNEYNWDGHSGKWAGYIGFNAFRNNEDVKDYFYGTNRYTGKGVFEGSSYGFRWLYRSPINNDSDGQHLLTEYMRLTNTGNLGIGTDTPSQKLEIYNPNAFNTNMQAESQDHISFTSDTPGIGNFFGGITWKTGARRRAAIAAVQEHTDSDHIGLAFFTKGTDGAGPIYESVRITRNGSMGIGTTTPDAKLAVRGNIHAQEVKVDLNGAVAPDYVFKVGYDLRSLQEVQDHIKEHGHLPNIPSAQEMEANGIDLGQMNLKLLEKIEELTLYTLAQEEQLKQKNEQLNNITEKLQELEKRIDAIKNQQSN